MKPFAFVFPGQYGGDPLCNQMLLRVLRNMGLGGKITTHGFRATFKTWAEEKTPYDSKVIEKALSHTIGDSEVERTYMRGALLEKRRALMDDWAAYCVGETATNVVKLRA